MRCAAARMVYTLLTTPFNPLALVVLLALTALGPIIPAMADAPADTSPPVAVRGVMDLRAWPTDGDAPLRLAGEWAFYWNRLLAPDDFTHDKAGAPSGWFPMPGVWNGYVVNERPLAGSGKATFRLTIALPPGAGRQALLVPYAFTAYRLWVGDWLAASVGRVGASREMMTAEYRTRVVIIEPPADGRLVLTLQISNFMHAKGGMRDPIRFVAATQVSSLKQRGLVKDVLVFGCLLIMGIYHLMVFMLRRSDRFNLYFALLCFLFGIRAGLTGEVFLLELFRGLDWQITVRLEWLCAYTGGPLGVAFASTLFPDESHKTIYRGCLIIAAVLALTTLLTPSTVFTGLFPYVTPVISLMLGYTTWVLFRAMLDKRYGAGVMLASMILVFATVINDILYSNELVHTGHYISYGMIIFVFSQAMILANRSAKAYSGLETTNVAYAREIRDRKEAQAKVKAYQDRLEDLVQTRTEALAVANRRLQQELDERKVAEAEKLKLQEQLQRAQKMEALGTLAGGVAHDLNNILSGVVGYPDLLLHELPPDSPMRRPMQTIQQSGQKAAAIVQDLLTLARRGVAEFKLADLNQIVMEYLESPEYHKLIQFHPRVTLQSELADDLLCLKGSPVHLQKTVMNLVSNAAEAMPDGGTIRLSTLNQTVHRPSGDYDRLPAGQYVVLCVTDTGIGISKADMARIFEPFYTKKVMGKSGTGLGMAVVWGTVKDHGGFIDVRSREGAGTTFTIHFPASTEKPAPAPPPWSPSEHRGEGQSVLVVDDVPEQRDIATAMLRKLGYRAEAVASGEAAIDRVANQPVDLLLLDMIMDPGIDGLETYRRIIERCPGQRAIIASGYTETDRVREAQRLGPVVYLKKPYRLDALAMTLSVALAGTDEPVT